MVLVYLCVSVLLLSLPGCSKSIIPKLSSPSKSASALQLEDEGQLDVESKTAHFSPPPRQLAGLLIKTAKAEGWVPKQKAVENDDRWIVTVRDPDEPPGRSEQNVFIESAPDGGSTITVGTERASLPERLLGPLKVNVKTHYEPPKVAAKIEQRQRDYSGKKSPADVVVTAGTPMRPYRKLGKVRASVKLKEKTLTQALWEAPTSWFADDEDETSRTRLFNKLSEHALVKYGNQVDAIIKARYKVRTGGSAFASGLAVQYVSTEERLDEVERLLDRGYLSKAEYATKRAKILEGL